MTGLWENIKNLYMCITYLTFNEIKRTNKQWKLNIHNNQFRKYGYIQFTRLNESVRYISLTLLALHPKSFLNGIVIYLSCAVYIQSFNSTIIIKLQSLQSTGKLCQWTVIRKVWHGLKNSTATGKVRRVLISRSVKISFVLIY